ncbi:MAG: CHAT domain-containing protein [Okeania sp. SIO2D1]|nr:CHAT domain-containing protein [Okeania sp. SIO2D1]
MTNISRNTFASVRGNTRSNLPESTTEGNCQNEDKCLRLMHEILIKPIAKLLPQNPEEEVIIIPDGELFRVPFAALKGSDNKYLIQKHILRVSPSIKLLQITQQQKARKAPNLSNQNLVVGNPVMPKGFGALPGAEKEAEAIAKLLNTTAITGARATIPRVTKLMTNANIIHLATHGYPRGLIFTPSKKDMGFLEDWRIYRFKSNLTADLVVLSACETGLGDITTDGVVGIARPFIGAGVPSVVVSLWRVPDAQTSELMVDFYKNLQAGQNKAQALRQAMLSTMKKYPEPVNWAGFFLVGES